MEIVVNIQGVTLMMLNVCRDTCLSSVSLARDLFGAIILILADIVKRKLDFLCVFLCAFSRIYSY